MMWEAHRRNFNVAWITVIQTSYRICNLILSIYNIGKSFAIYKAKEE